jgi:hypothetical protein
MDPRSRGSTFDNWCPGAAVFTSAYAASQKALEVGSSDNVEAAFVAMFAMMLVWSVAAMTFSKTPRIYKAAADTNKTFRSTTDR